jgi:hypothetical protein
MAWLEWYILPTCYVLFALRMDKHGSEGKRCSQLGFCMFVPNIRWEMERLLRCTIEILEKTRKPLSSLQILSAWSARLGLSPQSRTMAMSATFILLASILAGVAQATRSTPPRPGPAARVVAATALWKLRTRSGWTTPTAATPACGWSATGTRRCFVWAPASTPLPASATETRKCPCSTSRHWTANILQNKEAYGISIVTVREHILFVVSH